MKLGYSRQYEKPCLLITKEDGDIEAILVKAREEGAVYDDGEGETFVVQFVDGVRPGIQELYTKRALRSSLRSFVRA